MVGARRRSKLGKKVKGKRYYICQEGKEMVRKKKISKLTRKHIVLNAHATDRIEFTTTLHVSFRTLSALGSAAPPQDSVMNFHVWRPARSRYSTLLIRLGHTGACRNRLLLEMHQVLSFYDASRRRHV